MNIPLPLFSQLRQGRGSLIGIDRKACGISGAT